MFSWLLAAVPVLGDPQKLKLIAGAVAILLAVVVLFGGGFAMGYRWESSAFDSYKAAAAAHELALQQKYDAIGGDESRAYTSRLESSQARTEKELEALRNAPPIPAPPAIPGKGKARKPSAPVAADGDTARTVRVLRDAFARSKN